MNEYLPNGLRSSKTVSGIKTGQFWDGQNLLFETDSNGTISNYYDYGIDMIRESKSNTYYNYNAHGDVVQLTDGNGTVKADYNYDAFGNQKTSTSVNNPFRYCGDYSADTTKYNYTFIDTAINNLRAVKKIQKSL